MSEQWWDCEVQLTIYEYPTGKQHHAADTNSSSNNIYYYTELSKAMWRHHILHQFLTTLSVYGLDFEANRKHVPSLRQNNIVPSLSVIA